VRVGDTDFRPELLAQRANELADNVGNLINRVITLINRFASDPPPAKAPPSSTATHALSTAAQTLPERVDAALAEFDLRGASAAILQLAVDANRLISLTRPWELARSANGGDREARTELDDVLSTLAVACNTITDELAPFLPEAAARIKTALTDQDNTIARRLFPRIT
jgi:methionyl-tRNA synthetase